MRPVCVQLVKGKRRLSFNLCVLLHPDTPDTGRREAHTRLSLTGPGQGEDDQVPELAEHGVQDGTPSEAARVRRRKGVMPSAAF